MASALSALANATATFQVAGTGVITDPATGNVRAVTTEVTVALFLKAGRVESSPLPGVNVVETMYEGYAVNPTDIDARVVVGTEGTLSFAGQDPVECEVVALRLPYGNNGLLGSILSTALGEKIELLARGQG